MEAEKFLMFENRLRKVYRHLIKQARRTGTTCYRLYDHDLPEFPFCIEVYEEKIYVAEYKRYHKMTEEEHEAWLLLCVKSISEILSIAEEHIFLKLRQRKPGRLGQYQRLAMEQNEFTVHENGLKFIINLSDYLDTGLFLDHRPTRQMVSEQAADKNVLNLFAYTGSFSVYAAAGRAGLVHTVDLSNTYLNWAKRNMELNGFTDSRQYLFTQADVIAFLKTIPVNYYDIIVMDPPTFSNSKRMDDILDIQRDHTMLINDCLRGLKKEGRLYFSTNSQKFVLEKEKINAPVKDITKATTSFDFEGKLQRHCFLITKPTD